MLFLAIVSGMACGATAAAPLVRQLRARRDDFTRGFSAVIFAFALIQLAMLAVYALAPDLFAPFGTTATLVFLGCVTATVVRCNNG